MTFPSLQVGALDKEEKKLREIESKRENGEVASEKKIVELQERNKNDSFERRKKSRANFFAKRSELKRE